MNRKRNLKLAAMLAMAALVLVMVACAAAASTPEPAVAPHLEEAASEGEREAKSDVAAEEPAEEAGVGSGEVEYEEAEEMPPAAPMPTAEAADAAKMAEAGGYGGGGGEGDVVTVPDEQFQVSLTAGEIDDNADFSAYLQYRLDFQRFLGGSVPVHDVDISERHTIRVTGSNGLPLLGAEVLVYDGQNLVTALRTPATGIVYFFPFAYPAHANAGDYTVTVQKGSKSKEFGLTRGQTDAVWDMSLDTRSSRQQVQLDVLFLLDSTGSMGDEIAQLKDNILSISAQVAALPSSPDVRFGMVTYRDREDVYVTRVTDFTADVREFQTALQEVQAAGGGDNPESLNEALHFAIWDVDWRIEDTVSLIFLVADAPPHLDYAQDYDYAEEMMNAAGLGIKIHPIASSGLDDQGEYIFRQIGQFTGGHFIFLTYEETPQTSGEPGTEHHVQEESYTVEDLDALVVRLIQKELAALSGE
jgi:hypothetical protein